MYVDKWNKVCFEDLECKLVYYVIFVLILIFVVRIEIMVELVFTVLTF